MSRWPGNATKERTSFGGLSRSQLMARVRSTGNLTTEAGLARLLRLAQLHGWRRHQALSGRPDFVWRSSKVAVFVDGCFWHGHDCGRNVTPRTNARAWDEKIRNNQRRDARVTRTLRRGGWKVYRIAECELARRPERCVGKIRAMLRRADSGRIGRVHA